MFKGSEVPADLRNESKGLYKKLARVALPIAIQGLVTSSLGLIDNLMVGSLGETELASVGVGVQIFFIFYLLVYGFNAGCSTYISQFYGANDWTNIRKTVGIMATLSMGVGVIFFAGMALFPRQILSLFTDIPEVIELGVGYIKFGAPCVLILAIVIPLEVAIRTVQKTYIPLITSVVAFVSNVTLNYMFIFGNFGMPRLGVAGAALGTTIARVLEGALLVLFLLFGKTGLECKPIGYFRWGKTLVKKVVRNSIPTTINEGLWGLGTSMYIAAFARVGVTEYASVQAANTIQNLVEMAAIAVGDATLIIIGQKLGEGRLDVAKFYSKKLIRLAILIGVAVGVIVMSIAKPLIGLFDFTFEGMRCSYLILLMYAVTMPISMVNLVLVVGILRSGGDTRFAMFGDLGTVWLIGVPAAFITALVLQWPIYWCVFAVRMDEVVKLAIMYFRYRGGKWCRNMAAEIKE